jgi:hypothetical protein
MTPEEHTLTQLQFVVQTADRLGLDPEPADETVLLPRIQAKDAQAHTILETFRAAYRDWYKTSGQLQQSAQAGGTVDGLRQTLIQRITERDRTRRELVSYLDTNYPRGGFQRFGGDIVAASGIPT